MSGLNIWDDGSIFLDYSKPNTVTLFIILVVVKEDLQIILKSMQKLINILCSFLKIFTYL